MGRIRQLRIRNYRSIKDWVEVAFPQDGPLILMGENNSGKSNIVRALELLHGETWPGSHQPEDHEFFDRRRENSPIEIIVDLSGVSFDRYGQKLEVFAVWWRYDPDQDGPSSYQMEVEGFDEPRYVSNAVREQCFCIVVGADRRLDYQLSYASKYTLLSKLMRKFHRTLTSDEARVSDLRDKFAETRELFQSVEAFATFASELRRQVEELSSNLEYQLQVDFSAYDPSNFFHALRVYPYQDGQVRTFEELGTGQEQILALSLAYAYARAFHGEGEGLLVVIEEPEAHLHPLAQEWVSRRVHELAREGVQVVITTHSPAFLDVENLEGFALVRKDGNATNVVQLSRQELAQYCHSTGATKATTESILPFYSAAATEEILSGFFARRIVLVEGPTEALALPVYFGRVELNPMKEGIAIIPVHGVGNLAKWWRFFTAYGIPVYVIFDNDSSEDPDEKKRSDILETLGLAADRRQALLASKEWSVENNFSVLGVNFEATMRACFGNRYRELEDEARRQFGLSAGQSKPLVARYVAERISLEEGADGVERMRALAEAIRQLGPI